MNSEKLQTKDNVTKSDNNENKTIHNHNPGHFIIDKKAIHLKVSKFFFQMSIS